MILCLLDLNILNKKSENFLRKNVLILSYQNMSQGAK